MYQLDSDPALTQAKQDLNAAILRVAASPQDIQPAALANIPPSAGTFRIPVVSLHMIGDLFVPLSTEQVYSQRAAANGTSQLLVSRAIREVGHCGFTESEQAAAFADLVRWVEAGVKPAGDDILTPDVVASRTFGLRLDPGAALARAVAPRRLRSRGTGLSLDSTRCSMCLDCTPQRTHEMLAVERFLQVIVGARAPSLLR